ncbi:agmatine/peptidylarginine deiminase [Novipirellula sp.]|uniref:agmatine deiminase family protein n=1 Tax=Novipirellula sp. TaxID=2795430 RepID=UPI0035680403
MSRRTPAEWEPQEAVWLAWPHSLDTWPGRFDRMPAFFAKWATQMAESTAVRILLPESLAGDAKAFLPKNSPVELVFCPTNDSWVRDFGPTFVHDSEIGGLVGIDWRYNAWGGKYPPWDADDAAAAQICDHIGIPAIRSKLCLEGGAIETDGQGRLLTTPECLITSTRNPGWSSEAISQELHAQMGVTEILWLSGGGLVGDDTDGHIDQLARFLDPCNIVVAVCDDPNDPNHKPLEDNYRQLRLWGETSEPKVNVHRLPIPAKREVDGQRVPESYCNFLMLGRQRLLVPTFGQPAADEHAIAVIRELACGAQVEAIDCQDLIWGLGALHCASRDQPKASEA